MTGLVESLNISGSPYVNALISVLLFTLVAKAADYLVEKVLRRFTRSTKSALDDRIIDAVHRPVYFSIILVGLAIAIKYLKPGSGLLFYTDNAVYSLMAVIWTIAAIKITNAVLEHSVEKVSDVTGLGKDILPLVENVSKIVLVLLSLMVVLSIWRVNITPLLASAGIAGVAVAIAAKDTLSNFFGGLSIFMDKPYKVGDFIVLDNGDGGEVVSIGLRSTRIRTLDNILITIPNSVIASSRIVNESAPIPDLRFRIAVSVAYGSDIDTVEKILLEVASSNEKVLSEPAPIARFKSFGDSGLNYELLCWAKEPLSRWLAIHELNRAVYKAFAKEGITIPFPQRDINIRDLSSLPARERQARHSARHKASGEELF